MLRAVTRITLPALLLAACGGKSQPAPVAPAPAPEPTAAPAPEPEPNGPFLYKADGATGPVYLFGTIHIAVDPKEDLDPIVWNSFTACKKLVLEIDLGKVSMISMALSMLNTDGPGLDEQLGPDYWAKLQQIAPPQFRGKILKGLKPFAVEAFLQLGDLDASKSMEPTFTAYANENGLEVGALETMQDQLAALAESSNIDSLKKYIDNYEDSRKGLADMIDSYKAGDIASFKKMFESPEEGEEVSDALLKNRNERWAPQIEEMLKTSGDIFIAVGAGHLWGQHGVIELMKQRGFEFERVLPAAKPAASGQIVPTWTRVTSPRIAALPAEL